MTNTDLFTLLFKAARAVYDEREAHSVACFIAEKLYGANRIHIATEPHGEVDAPGLESVLRDIAAGRPAQYVAGKADFCGMEFAVGEGVLIPRPETEELVEWVAGDTAPGTTALDIGTGSGAIAVALAKKIAGSVVHAADISAEALAFAAKNAATNGAQVSFTECDILAVGSESPWPPGMFDIIVSNPPYIPAGDRGGMHINVTEFEPAGALFVPDDDPLVFYKAIARKGRTLLKTGGRLFFEIYEHSAGEMRRLLETEGYSGIAVRKDINGRDRMVKAVKG